MCHNRAMQEHRRRVPLTPEQRLRSNARAYLHVYLRRGKVRRGPCIFCGEPSTQAHHEDYSKPLEVTWVCDFHHRALHSFDRR